MDRLSNRMSLCSVLRVESLNERHLSSTTTTPTGEQALAVSSTESWEPPMELPISATLCPRAFDQADRLACTRQAESARELTPPVAAPQE